MTEIYNDLSKNTTGSTIAEVRDDTLIPYLLKVSYGVGWSHKEASGNPPGPLAPRDRLAMLMGVVDEGISSRSQKVVLWRHPLLVSRSLLSELAPEPELAHWGSQVFLLLVNLAP